MFRPNPNHHGWGNEFTAGVKSIDPRPSLSTSSSLSSLKRSAIPTTTINNDEYQLHEPNQNIDDRTQQLKSPQRIEIERNDAIDILACLVERGVSWKQPSHEPEPENLNSVQSENVPNDEDQNTEPLLTNYDNCCGSRRASRIKLGRRKSKRLQ